MKTRDRTAVEVLLINFSIGIILNYGRFHVDHIGCKSILPAAKLSFILCFRNNIRPVCRNRIRGIYFHQLNWGIPVGRNV